MKLLLGIDGFGEFTKDFMMLLLNHIAIIVSSEEGVEFYKKLGFEEQSRELRPSNHDELIYLSDGLITLEIYKDSTHPPRVTNPEAYGLRHLCFQTENIGDDYKIDAKGKFMFIYDPDGQPIEIREVQSQMPENGSFSE